MHVPDQNRKTHHDKRGNSHSPNDLAMTRAIGKYLYTYLRRPLARPTWAAGWRDSRGFYTCIPKVGTYLTLHLFIITVIGQVGPRKVPSPVSCGSPPPPHLLAVERTELHAFNTKSERARDVFLFDQRVSSRANQSSALTPPLSPANHDNGEYLLCNFSKWFCHMRK